VHGDYWLRASERTKSLFLCGPQLAGSEETVFYPRQLSALQLEGAQDTLRCERDFPDPKSGSIKESVGDGGGHGADRGLTPTERLHFEVVD